jgi:hypothetical protein
VLKGMRARKERQDLKVTLEHKEQLEARAQRVHKDLKGTSDHKVI